MNSRQMYVAFEELLRNTNPELEFDTNINTDVAFRLLTRAEEEYIEDNFLSGDSIQDRVNAIRKRSDVLRKLIKRCAAVQTYTKKEDGGYSAQFGTDVATPVALTDYWMFLSGMLSHPDLPTNDSGYSGETGVDPRIELDLINHYDLQKKIRTVNNEPIYKYIPIVLEGDNNFAFYLDKEQFDALDGSINTTKFHINYLARPVGIDLVNQPSLAASTHNDIVKRAVEIFVVEYKYKLGTDTTKTNG